MPEIIMNSLSPLTANTPVCCEENELPLIGESLNGRPLQPHANQQDGTPASSDGAPAAAALSAKWKELARHRNAVVRALSRLSWVSKEDAEDIAEEAVLKAMNAEGILNPRGWLVHAGRTLALQLLRDRKTHERHLKLVARTSKKAAVDPALEAQARELAARYKSALAALPERERNVWKRRKDRKSVFKLAQKYKVSERRIRQLLGEVREQLCRRLGIGQQPQDQVEQSHTTT